MIGMNVGEIRDLILPLPSGTEIEVWYNGNDGMRIASVSTSYGPGKMVLVVED